MILRALRNKTPFWMVYSPALFGSIAVATLTLPSGCVIQNTPASMAGRGTWLLTMVHLIAAANTVVTLLSPIGFCKRLNCGPAPHEVTFIGTELNAVFNTFRSCTRISKPGYSDIDPACCRASMRAFPICFVTIGWCHRYLSMR